jgi:hypothetical protein
MHWRARNLRRKQAEMALSVPFTKVAFGKEIYSKKYQNGDHLRASGTSSFSLSRYIKGAPFFNKKDGAENGAGNSVGATISGTSSAVVATATEAASTIAGGGISEGTRPAGEGAAGPSTFNQKVVGQGYKQVSQIAPCFAFILRYPGLE